jgi:hypothetical protein
MKYIIELNSDLSQNEIKNILLKLRMKLGAEGVLMNKHIKAYDGEEKFQNIEMSVDKESTMFILNNGSFGKKGDIAVKQSCDNCEFNFGVCGGFGKMPDNNGETYGTPVSELKKMFPNGCEDWGVALKAYGKDK